MPLEQIGLSSSVLASRSERSARGTGAEGPAEDIAGPSTSAKSLSYGGVTQASLEGVRRTSSLNQASRFHRHFASSSGQDFESAATRSATHDTGHSAATLPRGIGRYGSRWQSQWPDAEDGADHPRGGLNGDDDDGDTTHDASAHDDNASLSPRGAEMTLLKLSGMGGVTRSGSMSLRGQAASREGSVLTPRSQYRSSLSVSPEDASDDTADFEDYATFRRPTIPFAWNEVRAHGDLPPLVGVKRISSHNSPQQLSEIPSPLSRASTSSSSAPAHSLSTLTTRHSVSSSSSASTKSSSRHRQLSSDDDAAEGDDSQTQQRRRAAGATEDAASETATSTAAESEATAGRLRTTEAEGNAAKPYSVDDDIPDPASQVGPSVQRIRSIGRGNNARMASFNREEQAEQGGESYEESSLAAGVLQDEHDITLMNEGPRDADKRQSSPRRVQVDAVTRLQRDPFGKLTWTEAAQAPSSPDQDRTDFVPPAPRRHTGSYALRSKSALSSGTMGQFSGGGRGRAGMREAAAQVNAAKPTVASSVSDSREDVVEASAQTPSPEQDRFMSRMSEWLASRDTTSQQQARPPSQTSSPKHASRRSSAARAETSPRITPRTRNGGSLSLHHDEVPLPPLDATLLIAQPQLDGASSSDADPTARPALLRATTQGANVNVLRTPTTQEWSRYLIKKGINPAAIVQQVGLSKTHGRSRSGTMKSSSSFKSDAELLPISTSMTLPESAAASATDNKADIEAESKAASYAAVRSPRLRAQPRLSALSSSSFGRLEDLALVPEDGTVEDIHQAPPNRRLFESDEADDKSDTSDSSLDERMRALHEAISRPPSRMGSPVLNLTLGDLRMEDERHGDIDDIGEPHQWPQRETAAAVMGYPLAPPGERRTINDFVITGEIGRGAYGLVKKARVKDPQSNQPIGPEFCIKYIIKSRILADCWRRHKTLGPIPVEIHVLDQLRRLTHHIPLDPPPWSAEKLMGIQTKESEGVFEVSESGAFCVGHPALCKMLDFFEDHEFYYLVMPCFGSGQDLFDYVESQPHGLSTLQVRSILGQLADGLKFLHANNIVHRDVKDENVILDGEGHIQLIDFGSAAHILGRSPGSSARRLFDTFSGTLDYAAAEILRGEKYSGKEQDVWALGVVGYVLLCGDCPFWNGEEAMQGLGEGTRALNVLKERCAPPSPSTSDIDESEGKLFDLAAFTADDPFVGRAVRRHRTASGEATTSPRSTQQHTLSSPQAQAMRRQRDLVGQGDGGGCLADAANLIACCLDLDQSARPTMEQILQHRFLAGARGWTGSTWWLRSAADRSEE